MLKVLFFYDGPLTDIATTEMENEDLIDAKDGYSKNITDIERIIKDDKEHMVVSNQIKLLDNKYLWDHRLHLPKLCLLDKSDGKWKPVGRFTKKDLKYIHNLEKMYLENQFSDKAFKTIAKKKPRKLIGVYVQ